MSVAERAIELMRPVSNAYRAPASPRCVELEPGKFAAVKMLVDPVFTGSPVARPKEICGTTCVLTAWVNDATRVNANPRFSVCAPRNVVRLSVSPLTGVLRRD